MEKRLSNGSGLAKYACRTNGRQSLFSFFCRFTSLTGSALLAFFLFLVLFNTADARLNSSHHACRGTLLINVSTNVSKFALKSSMSQIVVNRPCTKADSLALLTKKYWFSIPARHFQSDNKQIHRDFLTLVKANDYPDIRVGFLLMDLHHLMVSGSPMSIPVEVSLAGTNMTYGINCRYTSIYANCVSISGAKTIKLTDFGITPPKKFLGLVSVNNEINITFAFSLIVEE